MTSKTFSISPVTAEILEKYSEGVRNFALEGSARSSKTWSIIHLIHTWCKENEGKGKRVTAARDKRTWIKETIYKDLNDFILHYGLTGHIRCINVSELIYDFYGNEVQLIGMDDPMKVHGRKQHVLWVNEVMGCEWTVVNQLMMRTEEMIIFDWNPSQLKHWVFERILPRTDFYYNHSTYKDNPFLPAKIRIEIEKTEPTPVNIEAGTADEYTWKVYGLGVRAGRIGVVYPRWHKWNEKSLPPKTEFIGYGVDFGFSESKAAIVGMWECERENSVYFKEFIYQTGLTDEQLAAKMKEVGLNPQEDYAADCEDGKAISVLRQRGFRVHSVKKPPGSVEAGIKYLQGKKIHLHENSVNMQNEITGYSFKLDNDGQPIEAVVKKDDHLMDAMRYIAYWYRFMHRKLTYSFG